MEEVRILFQRVFELVEGLPWDFRYHLESEGNDFGGDKTRIYLVDTQKGWYAHAAVSVTQYIEASDELKRSGITHDQLTLIANQVIHEAKNETVTPETTELILSITALWLAGTATFTQLFDNGALDAHLFAISYTTQSGIMLLRPSAAMNSHINFYPIDEVLGATRQVVAMDTNNTKTYVGQSLNGAGGAILSPVFS